MRKIRNICFFLFVTVCITASQAQIRTNFWMSDENHRFMISLAPIPLIIHAFEVDFDAKIKENLWIQLAPQYNKYKNELNGGGFRINLRYYDPNVRGLYYAGGIFFDANNVRDSALNKEQNPSYKEGNPIFYNVDTKRIGGQFNIGAIFRILPRTTLDIFGGFCFKKGFYSFREGSPEIEIRKMPLKSYLYEGISFQLGIRIGFML